MFCSFILCRISSFFCNENRPYLPLVDDCEETACFYLAQNITQILSLYTLFLCFIVLVINKSLFLEFVIFLLLTHFIISVFVVVEVFSC